MESKGGFKLKAPDHATTLDLITKVCNLSVAESYFNKLSSSSSQKEAAYYLLHRYVKESDLEKSEALMQKLLNSGLAVNPFLFNEMMKLYMATNEFEKVISVIKHMKLSKVPLTVLSYSLWLNASFEVFGVSSVEKVYQEMKNDENINIGWSTYGTLANTYTKAGYTDKAFASLRVAEEKLSTNDRLAYFFIMTCYAALKDKNGVLRMWECSKKVRKRFTCANYMSVMSCLVKVGDIESAERIFRKWESQCRKYDIRVSNVLLGAYVRKGWMNRAETLHNHTLKVGACPNYKTWEILMEGYFSIGEMDKVVDAMKKGFFKLNGCIWKPPIKIVLAIAEYFEERGNITEMRSYVNLLNELNCISLPVYKSALRTHIRTQTNASDIIGMIERDKVECDYEMKRLIEYSNKPVNLDGETEILPCPPPLKSFFDRIFK